MRFFMFLLVVGFVSVMGTSIIEKTRDARLIALRETDPETYLFKLKLISDDRWLAELQKMRPRAYSEELARRQIEARKDLLVPAEPTSAFDAEKLVANSDDVALYQKVFTKAATALLENGLCTDADFIENGGWVKSMSFKPRAIYFTYCGGATVANRIYLNAATGEIFR